MSNLIKEKVRLLKECGVVTTLEKDTEGEYLKVWSDQQVDSTARVVYAKAVPAKNRHKDEAKNPRYVEKREDGAYEFYGASL